MDIVKERFDVYIGHGTTWGNEFFPKYPRAEAIAKYRQQLWVKMQDQKFCDLMARFSVVAANPCHGCGY